MKKILFPFLLLVCFTVYGNTGADVSEAVTNENIVKTSVKNSDIFKIPCPCMKILKGTGNEALFKISDNTFVSLCSDVQITLVGSLSDAEFDQRWKIYANSENTVIDSAFSWSTEVPILPTYWYFVRCSGVSENSYHFIYVESCSMDRSGYINNAVLETTYNAFTLKLKNKK